MTIEAVLDSNVVNSISRSPKKPPNDALSSAVEKRRLRVCADHGGGIVGEWMGTAKPDVVKNLIVHWQQFDGFRLIHPAKSLPYSTSSALRRLNFRDTIDKLLLRTAMETADRRVVSNDPDFWDPGDRKRAGDPNAPVATLCRDELGITVSRLTDLANELSPVEGRLSR